MKRGLLSPLLFLVACTGSLGKSVDLVGSDSTTNGGTDGSGNDDGTNTADDRIEGDIAAAQSTLIFVPKLPFNTTWTTRRSRRSLA